MLDNRIHEHKHEPVLSDIPSQQAVQHATTASDPSPLPPPLSPFPIDSSAFSMHMHPPPPLSPVAIASSDLDRHSAPLSPVPIESSSVHLHRIHVEPIYTATPIKAEQNTEEQKEEKAWSQHGHVEQDTPSSIKFELSDSNDAELPLSHSHLHPSLYSSSLSMPLSAPAPPFDHAAAAYPSHAHAQPTIHSALSMPLSSDIFSSAYPSIHSSPQSQPAFSTAYMLDLEAEKLKLEAQIRQRILVSSITHILLIDNI